MGIVIVAIAAGLSLLILFMAWINWYRKCPSDRIMVIYGRTGLSDGRQKPALCIHGGAKFVWPVFQDYGYISLRPMQIEVNLNNALCQQNIRINVPSVFTVGVSTKPEIMGNAAERLSIMKNCYDGYEIAERDLAMRGPGDFLRSTGDESLRQSGGVRFRLGELCDDTGLLTRAAAEARALLEADPTLASYPVLAEKVNRLFLPERGTINSTSLL